MVDDREVPDNPVMNMFWERAQGRATGRWAFHATAAGMTPISSASLFAAATRHAHRGLRARSDEEHDDACLQLGIMLEHLAKAYLAQLHPTLLIEDRFDFSSLVRLAGLGDRLGPGATLKTVGLQGALQRIGMLQAPGNRKNGEPFDSRRLLPVLHARNGVAHVGEDGGAADEVAQLAISGAQEILQLMGRALGDLFGEYTEAAEALLDEHASAVRQLVTLLLVRARTAFQKRFAGTNQAQVSAIDRHTRATAEGDDTQYAVECPACHRLGLLVGSLDLVVHSETPEQAADPSAPPATVVLVVESFRCPACGLRLHGGEQLAEAQLPASIVELRPARDEDILWFLRDAQSDDRDAVDT